MGSGSRCLIRKLYCPSLTHRRSCSTSKSCPLFERGPDSRSREGVLQPFTGGGLISWKVTFGSSLIPRLHGRRRTQPGNKATMYHDAWVCQRGLPQSTIPSLILLPSQLCKMKATTPIFVSKPSLASVFDHLQFASCKWSKNWSQDSRMVGLASYPGPCFSAWGGAWVRG